MGYLFVITRSTTRGFISKRFQHDSTREVGGTKYTPDAVQDGSWEQRFVTVGGFDGLVYQPKGLVIVCVECDYVDYTPCSLNLLPG